MEALKASSPTLEITVMSAENLFVDQNPVTENAYVVIRPESINRYTTGMAREGGSCPSWNEKFFLDIPFHARSVTFEVHYKMPTGAVRSVGIARIALSDFLAEGTSPGNLQFLSYRLRNWDGRRNGIINFSVKVKTPEHSVPAKGMALNSAELERKVTGVHLDDMNSNGSVAIGIPVHWNYYPTKVFTCN